MKEKVYDAIWFPRIKDIHANVPRYLRAVSVKDVREDFFSGEQEVSFFAYPSCEPEMMLERIGVLQMLSRDLLQEENETVREIYQDLIDEKIQKYEFLHEWSRFLADAMYPAQQLQEKLDAIYGVPDKAIFTEIMQGVAGKLADTPLSLRDESWNRLHQICMTLHALPRVYQEEPDTSDIVLPEHIPAHIAAYLQEKGYTDWTVEISVRQRDKIRVSLPDKKFVVPSIAILTARHKIRPYSERRLRALLAHEVDTHVRRAENGAASPLQLLGIGLVGYRQAEEGIALLREEEVFPQGVVRHDWYIAASLACGLDCGMSRDFRETFLHMRAFYELVAEQEKNMAHKHAFNLCVSIFVRPHAHAPALRFMSRLMYQHGARAVRTMLAEHPERHVWLDRGKFDPTNERQTSQLSALGILR